MMRFIMPIVLVGIAISVFMLYTNDLYTKMGTKRADIASYDEALSNAAALDSQKQKLTQIKDGISEENRAKLLKLLPDNVDNIRLILEIEKIASPYNMVLTDVKYNTADPTAAPLPASGAIQGAAAAKPADKSYGTFNLEFSTTGSYANFLAFLSSLESNLRIVDISSIQFDSSTTNTASDAKTTTKIASAESYKYSFSIKTYWLKK